MSIRRAPQFVLFVGASVWLIVLLEAISGVIISTRFSASAASSHQSVLEMRTEPLWTFLTAFHYWGSGLAIVLSALNLLCLLWIGGFRRETRWLWWGGLGIAVISLFAQMTGNLLPFSQHDARTAITEASIAAQAPVVGQKLFHAALGGDQVGEATLSRWYFAHRFVVAGGLLLLAIPALRAILAPMRKGRGLLWLLVPPGVVAVVSAIVAAPLGQPAGVEDVASPDASPMWYVLPLHALNMMFTGLEPTLGWVGALAVPLALLVILVLLPFWVRSEGRASVALGRFAAVAVVVFVFLSALAYGENIRSPLREPSFAPPDPPKTSAEGSDVGGEGLRARGAAFFEELPCIKCHSVGDKGSARVGPNLSGVGSKRDAEYLQRVLLDPKGLGLSRMPSFKHLPDDDRAALVEYLRSLK